MKNSFNTKTEITCSNNKYTIFDISKINGVKELPYSIKILLENLVRNEDGQTVTKKDSGAAFGALVGGALANENQKTKTTTGIVGYENRQRCQTKFKNSPKEEVVYSYSTITFILDGLEQTVEFQKSP